MMMMTISVQVSKWLNAFGLTRCFYLQNSSCFLQRRSSFSEVGFSSLSCCVVGRTRDSELTLTGSLLCLQSACWMNIVKDMDHYDAAIQSYLLSTVRSHKEEDDLLSPTQGIIQGLREVCLMGVVRGQNHDIVSNNVLGNNTENVSLNRTAPWYRKQRASPQRSFSFLILSLPHLSVLILPIPLYYYIELWS